MGSAHCGGVRSGAEMPAQADSLTPNPRYPKLCTRQMRSTSWNIEWCDIGSICQWRGWEVGELMNPTDISRGGRVPLTEAPDIVHV